MSNGIGIVGGGIAGLHLALYLQQHDVPVTLYVEATAEEQRSRRLPSTVVHWHATRERERILGVNHWDDLAVPGHAEPFGVHFLDWRVGPPEANLQFRARIRPGISVDQRLVTARLLDDFTERKGEAVVGRVEAADLVGLSEEHDFVAVCVGAGGLSGLFPRMPEHCPYDAPQRRLCAAVYEGVGYTDPLGIIFSGVPGFGELSEFPFLTADGLRTVLLFFALPGGPAEAVVDARYDDDPAGFCRTVVDLVERFAPATAERLDRGSFRVTGPLDVLQGGVTPTVRRPYAQLENGRWVMAFGDLHAVNDPLLGQGANAASAGAFILGEAILADGLAFDERFCRATAERLWRYVGAATEWNNCMLAVPPPDQVVQLILAAAEHPSLADEFTDQFADPEANWNILATPERTRNYLERRGIPVPDLAEP